MSHSLPFLPLALALGVAAAAGQTGTPKPIATHEHENGSVAIDLLEVKRTAEKEVTVRWRYRNKTKQPQQLTSARTGWIDPYRLAVGSYLADPTGKVKYDLMTDSDRRPIAGRHGEPNKFISVGPERSLSTWAKYPVPSELKTVTVVLNGTEPFEKVPISE